MTLFASATDRTIRGLLIPYGEQSRMSVSGEEPVAFARGAVHVPEDPTIITLNLEHDRFEPVGRATRLRDTDRGIEVEFSVAHTPEGDEALEAVESGRLSKLSAEVSRLVRDGARAVKARLTGAALVTEGAFASAALFALAPVEYLPAVPSTPEEAPQTENGGDTRDAAPEPEAPASEEPADEPEDDRETPEADTPAEDTEEGEEDMADAVIPEGVHTPPARTSKTEPDTSAGSLFSTLARTATMSRHEAMDAVQPYERGGSLFAFTDVTAGDRPAGTNGTEDPGTTGIGSAVMAPQYLGEIGGGRAYERKIVPLIQHADLTSLTGTGWRWAQGPTVGDWTGNKTEIPSSEVTLEPVTFTAARIAGGNDVDRALADFGNAEWWASYFAHRRESYMRQSDGKAYGLLSNGATVVTPGTVPTDTDPGVAALVDGAIAVIEGTYTPTFALVSSDIYRTLLLTKKDNVLEYLAANVGLESGSLAGFKIVPWADLAAGTVVVGDRAAATFYELPGSPIRVNAIDVVKGGLDDALYGYWAGLVNDARGLASVTVASGV